jgi:predicted CxxxxCH...CXXCH cytochrome family protein
MSSMHAKHAGSPLPEGTANSREFDCTICHFGYSPTHNESGYSAGQSWALDNSWRPNVDINFDSAWNPDSPTYKGLPMPQTGGDPPICASLYCHGDEGVFAGNRKTGANTTPGWDNAASGACGACHGTGTQMSSANHPVHLDNTSNPFGPGIDNASCGAGGACHTAYGLSPTTTHVDKAINFPTSASDNAPVLFAATGICENCHSTANAALDNGAGLGVGNDLAKLNWSDNNYKLPCLTCHNKTTGEQGNTNIDGAGNSAPNIEEHWLVTGHGASVIDNASTTTETPGDNPPVWQTVPVPCGMCHDIASSHFASTGKNTVNPWRLWSGTSFENNDAGLFDIWCAETCHSADPPANHTWNVAAGQTKESGDTHKTSTDIVPDSDKFQVPTATMPLEPFLKNKGFNQGGAADTDRFLCIRSHAPA